MMELFFKPGSVAVIGASKDPRKDGNVIVNNIINSEFRGAIYPVNPTADEVLGRKAYASLKDIPGEVDLAVIIIPAKFCVQAMEDCASKGVKAVIIESMGFTEIGAPGKKIQDRIEAIANKAGIRVMGPNCTGVVSRDISTTFFPIKDVPRGNDKVRARALLAEAGHGPNNPLKVEVVSRNIAIYRDGAAFVVDNLRQVGVESTLRLIDTTQWYGVSTRREYQMGSSIAGYGVDDPDSILSESFLCKSARNYQGYCDEEVDKLIAQQSQELDSRKRHALLARIQKKIEDDVARPVLSWRYDYFAHWPQVKNLVPHHTPYSYGRMQEVWLDR